VVVVWVISTVVQALFVNGKPFQHPLYDNHTVTTGWSDVAKDVADPTINGTEDSNAVAAELSLVPLRRLSK